MKRIPAGILFLLILTGCKTSHPDVYLTARQAGTLAASLANDKAERLVHDRPFQDNHSAKFLYEHWVWEEIVGIKRMDFEARVDLAADGSTNKVDLRMLDTTDPVGPGGGRALP